MSTTDSYDVAVIGAGFGGLGAALSLAERGFKVALFETLKYPGGCAGTFTRRGYRFEAGATLSAGFAPQQQFRRWIDRHQLDLELEWLDPVIHFRAPEFSLEIPPDRDQLIAELCALPDAPSDKIKRFFAHQAQVADTLWQLFDEPELLPPWDIRDLFKHAARIPRYAPLLRDVNRSLLDVLRRYKLDHFKPLKLYLDALCQITVQCSAEEAEAPFALSTLDYYGRGSAHVIGGIGRLADQLCEAITRCGGEVRLVDQVRSVTPLTHEGLNGGGFEVKSRRGTTRVKSVISNLLPQTTRRLLPEGSAWPRWASRMQTDVESGWSAAMLYLAAEVPQSSLGGAEHWQLIGDVSSPLREGNHVFCSISGERDLGRAPEGQRTLTLSTHIPAPKMRALDAQGRKRYITGVQRRMRSVFQDRCPEWAEQVRFSMTASPRTFERFTNRDEGLVGGIPRRRGWRHYLELGPRELSPDFYLVGDSVFPGQSTLATATGGTRVAEQLSRRWSSLKRPLLDVVPALAESVQPERLITPKSQV